MNILALALSGLSTVLIFSTALCGFWLKSHGATPEGAAFHAQLASSTMVVVLGNLALLVALLVKA